MHKYLFIAILCWYFPLQVQSNCEDAAEIIRLAERDLANRSYERAITAKKDQINALIKKAFQQIEAEKRSAQQAQKEAERAREQAEIEKAKAIEAEQEAQTQKERAERALLRVETEKIRADSSLALANQVLDQMYFYNDKFGLTFKKVDSVAQFFEDNYRYGYIDRNGKTVIPFEFEEASAFSSFDGFARVSKGQKKYLLDTAGELYLVAESLEELGPETEALDLHKVPLKSLPNNIGDFTRLKVLILPNAFQIPGLKSLPKSIGKLTQLKYLNLVGNSLTDLPKSFGQLQDLQRLALQHNAFTEVPPALGELKSLSLVDLRHNQITELPSFYFDFDILLRVYGGKGNVINRESVLSVVEGFEKDYEAFFASDIAKPEHLLEVGARLWGLANLADFSAEEFINLRKSLLSFAQACYERYPENDDIVALLGYSHQWLANIYYRLDQLDNSIQETHKMVQLWENRRQTAAPTLDSELELTYAYELLARAYSKADYAQSMPYIQKWLAVDQSLLEQYPKATRVYEDYYDALQLQAQYSLFLKEYATAEQAAQKALRFKRDLNYTHTFLIRAYILQGKLEEAKAHFDQINASNSMVSEEESWKQALLRQLAGMEEEGIFKGDNPNVQAFRAFLATRE